VVSTTSGTGSQVTHISVITNPQEKNKSALAHPRLFPRIAIVDPDLMLSVPAHVTASTGFDAFCHAFEAFHHVKSTPYVELMAQEAMRLVINCLPAAVGDGRNQAARESLAWADTLAGLCIASAGTTLPHGVAMTIGGYCPQVMHGEALAVFYPEFMRFTFPYAIEKFAALGRILNPDLHGVPARAAAEQSCVEMDRFLKKIGMWLSLEGLGVSEAEIKEIADHSLALPDYQNNPRIASRDEIFSMLSHVNRKGA
jgi:alcohol dehydrogenase